jgi:hypothetical protein
MISSAQLFFRMLAVAAALFLVVGCSAKKPVNQTIGFPEMHVEVDPEGKLPPRYWDSYSLYNKANLLFDAQSYDAARELYEKLLANYPDGELAGVSIFNIGLCHERMEQYEKAISYYAKLQHEFPDAVDPIRLRFRHAFCYENLTQWGFAISQLKSIFLHPKVTPVQKVQAQARLAMATFYLGKQDEAKKMLRAAMEKYENLRDRRITVDSYFYAKTCYTLGEYYFNRFKEIEFAGDAGQMEIRLENKATLFLLARAQYIKAIRTYDHEMLFASLFRVGQGFELFYFSMIEAPLPEDLAPSQKGAYENALKEKVEPVLRKSIEAYQRNVKMGADLKQKNVWLERSAKRLHFLEQWQQENQ